MHEWIDNTIFFNVPKYILNSIHSKPVYSAINSSRIRGQYWRYFTIEVGFQLRKSCVIISMIITTIYTIPISTRWNIWNRNWNGSFKWWNSLAAGSFILFIHFFITIFFFLLLVSTTANFVNEVTRNEITRMGKLRFHMRVWFEGELWWVNVVQYRSYAASVIEFDPGTNDKTS